MVAPGLRVSLCAVAPQLVSNNKTFLRVEEKLSWLDALRHCRTHHTDLADLQSVNSWGAVKALYSLTSRTSAWIGLFFDLSLGSLRWSSGSAFTAPVWSSLPVFKEGICATLFSVSIIPGLGAASCAAQKPFICYYVVVQIGQLTFRQFDQGVTWLAALLSCRAHHTDLADLQTVTDEDAKGALRSITNPSVGHRESAALPQLSHIPSGKETVGTTSRAAVSREGGSTGVRDTATATQAQNVSTSNPPKSQEKAAAPESGRIFGILKADFTVPALVDPEAMKEQFLSEIQEVLKLALGHKRFRLTWVGREGDKK